MCAIDFSDHLEQARNEETAEKAALLHAARRAARHHAARRAALLAASELIDDGLDLRGEETCEVAERVATTRGRGTAGSHGCAGLSVALVHCAHHAHELFKDVGLLGRQLQGLLVVVEDVDGRHPAVLDHAGSRGRNGASDEEGNGGDAVLHCRKVYVEVLEERKD